MTKKSKVDFLKGDWWKSITRVGRPDVLNVNAHASDTHGHIFLYWSEGFLSRRNKKSRRRLIGFFCSFKERKNKYKSFLSVDISKDKRESSTLFLMLYKSFHAPANKTRSNRLGNRNKKKRAGKMWIYVHTQDGRRSRPATLRATDIHQSIKVSQRHWIYTQRSYQLAIYHKRKIAESIK